MQSLFILVECWSHKLVPEITFYQIVYFVLAFSIYLHNAMVGTRLLLQLLWSVSAIRLDKHSAMRFRSR